jgi:hypothetical protein
MGDENNKIGQKPTEQPSSSTAPQFIPPTLPTIVVETKRGDGDDSDDEHEKRISNDPIPKIVIDENDTEGNKMLKLLEHLLRRQDLSLNSILRTVNTASVISSPPRGNSNFPTLQKQIHRLNMFSGKKGEFKQFVSSVKMIITSLEPFDSIHHTELINMVKSYKVSSKIFQLLDMKVIETLDDLEAALHSVTFECKSADEVLRKLNTYKIRANETIEKFALRIRNNFDELTRAYVNENVEPSMAESFAEKHILKCFIKGLPQAQRSIVAVQSEDSSLEDYISALKKSEYLFDDQETTEIVSNNKTKTDRRGLNAQNRNSSYRPQNELRNYRQNNFNQNNQNNYRNPNNYRNIQSRSFSNSNNRSNFSPNQNYKKQEFNQNRNAVSDYHNGYNSLNYRTPPQNRNNYQNNNSYFNRNSVPSSYNSNNNNNVPGQSSRYVPAPNPNTSNNPNSIAKKN